MTDEYATDEEIAAAAAAAAHHTAAVVPLAAAPAAIVPEPVTYLPAPAPLATATLQAPEPVEETRTAAPKHARDDAAPADTTAKKSNPARDRALIRRVANKAEELTRTDPDRLSLIVAVLGGAGSGLADLTTSIMAASSKDTQAFGDAINVIDADPMEAGVIATALGKIRLRTLWRLFVAMNVVAGEAPASEPKAAIALVRAIRANDVDVLRAQIHSALELLKK